MYISGPEFHFKLDQFCLDRIIGNSSLLGLDTEFTGLDFFAPDWRLKLVQIDTEAATYVFDISVPEQEEFVRGILEGALQFVSHNDADCLSVWVHFGIDITDRNLDTLTMARLLWPEKGVDRDLKTLCDKYVGPELRKAQEALYARFREILNKPVRYKKTGEVIELTEKQIGEGFRLIDVRDPVFVKYAAADAHNVRKLLYKMEPMMYQKGVHTAWEQECKVRAMATRMTFRGMRTSFEKVLDLYAEWGGRLDGAVEVFQDRYGCSPRSTQKVADLLLADGVELTERTKPSKTFPNGQWALGKEIVEALYADHMDNEKLQLLVEVAENSNVATFLKTLIGFIDPSGLVHSSISTLGTVTGRWSVTQPAVQTVSGANPCRSVFVPRPGNVLLSADLGQIEPRVAVGLAEERNLIPDLINGIDVYSAAVMAVFGPGYTPKQRKYMKRAILGTLYAAGLKTLVQQARLLDGWLDANEKNVGEVRSQWKKTAPAIVEYSRYLQGLPEVRLESGRYVPQDPARRYKAINSACQGTARDLLMDRAVEIDKRYPEYIIMTMHDELLMDVPADEVEQVASFVRTVMEAGYAGIPTPTDIEIFPECWGAQGVSLENYLKERNENQLALGTQA